MSRKSDAEETIGLVRGEIESRLGQLVPTGDERPASLHSAMRYSVLGGGKRIRAVLCVLTHEVTGGERRASAIEAGCAIECLHAYTLIHDDLPSLDDDDTRRGKPSCHKVFGEATALLAGDALQALAFSIMGNIAGPGAETVLKAVNLLSFASGSTMLVGGQIADIEGEGADPDPNTVRFIHTRKTAALIAASMSIGAALADAPPRIIDTVMEAGLKAGLAFQITDDLLDLEGDERTVGKGLRKDAEKGKITWPGCFGVEASRREALGLIEESIDTIASAGDDGRVAAVLRFITDRVS